MISNHRKTRGIHLRGTRAVQPVYTDVLQGTLYFVTDEFKLERAGAAGWETYSAAAQVNSDWASGSGVSQILNKPTIPTLPIAQSDVTGLVAALAAKIPLTAKVNITYAAGNFTCNGTSWTVDSGDIETYAYISLGNVVLFFYGINTASIVGSPTQLKILVPFTAVAATQNLGRYYDAVLATGGVMNAVIANGTNQLLLIKLDGTVWGNGTNHHYVFGVVPILI